MSADNPLSAYFERNPGRLLVKWRHYFDIYHRHFQRYRGKPCTVLEIGVYHGGSLEMWREYFGPQARIIGVDIEPRARALSAPGTEIVIGDQGDPSFLAELAQRAGAIDVLIDDGGHLMGQQIQTLLNLYPAIAADGVYLCEDVHTSYWQEFGGGMARPGTFIELTKRLIDQLNAWHSEDPAALVPDGFTASADSITFYDSVVVIEKRPRTPPETCRSGTPAFESLAEHPDS
jgi:hypothetical protein